MASFSAYLEVGGSRYPLTHYDLYIHQQTDALGRPASLTQGGTITCELHAPGQNDTVLTQWMLSPTKQHDGFVHLYREDTKAKLKTISFFNAYCVNMGVHFSATGSGPMLANIVISPQRVAVGAVVHDNNWPVESHGSGITHTPPTPPKEPSAFSEGLHTVLDVVGMIPVVGELADGANALMYAAEGDYANAAMSAASMIPLAGNVVGAAKLGKRALKIADKLGGATALAKKGIKAADKALDAVKGPLKKLKKGCGDPVDVASGDVMAEVIDFSLPGPMPLIWERNWLSSATFQGSTGYGWSHAYEWAIIAIAPDGTIGIRDGEGRLVAFEAPEPGGKGMQSERLSLFLDTTGSYRIWHMDELRWYTFGTAYAGQEHAQPLQSIEDPNGFAIRFAYNEANHLLLITDSAGRQLRVDTDEKGQIMAIHSPQTTEMPSFPLVRYEYDSVGNLVTAIDAEAHPMRYHYEGYQLIRRTSRTGTNWFFQYESQTAGARCVHTWGDGGLLDYTLHYDSDSQTTVLDSYQQPTVYTHENGIVIRQVDALGGEQRWTYSDTGQLLAEQDALGAITRYEYDEWDRQTTMILSGGRTIITQYNERGLIAQVIDARGSQWQWQYDERGNLLERTDPLGAITRYTYDVRGQLLTITNALEQTTNLRYDEQYNVAHLITPDEQIRSRNYDGLGRLITITDPTGVVQHRRYDRLGQLTEVEEADGTVRQLVYDPSGNVLEARQGDEVVTLTYTGLGQMSQRRQAGQEILFDYDKEGRLTGLTNEAGLRYRFGLDALGNVIEEEGFDGLLRRYERNAAGRVTRTLRPANRYTDYTYTTDGQVEQVRYSDGSQELYGYDETGGLIKAQNNTTTVRLERDALGQLVRESQNEHWIEYAYDLLGQRTAMRSSLGADIQFSRDQMGNLSQLTAQSWQARFDYDSRGLEVQRNLSGGVQSGWQRDALGRPVQQRIRRGDTERQRTYQWQPGDTLTQIEDTLAGISRYEHDVLGTLTSATYGDGTQELRLPDAVGNLFESATKTDRQYGPGGQLLSSSDATYTYDAEGNLIEKTTAKGEHWHYEWSGNGMLDKVIRPDGAPVTFAYDALGRRVSKTYKGKVTYWLWEGNKPLHEWQTLTLDGQHTEEIITWLFEEDSFAPMGKLQGTTRQSILTDHLGTPLEMVDQSGQRTWSAQTTAYGRVRLSEGTRAACPFRFQGQYEDVETGLYYNRFRYYDPREGIYIAQDSIRLQGGSRLYNYSKDPLIIFDPLGLVDFYHATNGKASTDAILNNGIDPSRGRPNLDFNPSGKGGFYVTTDLEQAQSWASRKGGQIIHFDVPEADLAKLKIKTFDSPTGEWADFVTQGRKGTLAHSFDAVSGPMLANPGPVIKGKASPKAVGQQVAMFTQEAAAIFDRNVKTVLPCS